MKAADHYFSDMLFVMLYDKMILKFWVCVVDETLSVWLLTDHSDKSYREVLSCGAVYHTVQADFAFQPVESEILQGTIQIKAIGQYFSVAQYNYIMLFKGILHYFWVCEWNPKVGQFKLTKATEQYFAMVICICVLYNVILKCDHSNRSY